MGLLRNNIHYYLIRKWCLLIASHPLSQQGASSYFAIMTEPASDFKDECYYSLQYSSEASLESNKEQNVYFKDPHFPLNAWIKSQTMLFWELTYVLKQCFWRSASCLEIGLWLACEFSNNGFWFSAAVAAAGFCILAGGFFLLPERMMNSCLSSSEHILISPSIRTTVNII